MKTKVSAVEAGTQRKIREEGNTFPVDLATALFSVRINFYKNGSIWVCSVQKFFNKCFSLTSAHFRSNATTIALGEVE